MSKPLIDNIVFPFKLLFQSVLNYKYKPERYANIFVSSTPKVFEAELFKFPRIIYVFWTGENEMSDNRKSCIESIKKNAGVEVVLVTPTNLDSFILSDYPLHSAFEYLSHVHKSDYLRCYFMYHFGGGYSDVKMCTKNWVNAFEKLEKSKKWLLGYREIKTRALAKAEGNMKLDMHKHYLSVIGNCAYICRPKNPFCKEWYDELHIRLDNYAEALKNNPGNIFGDNQGYPISWSYILGDIFHPLCLKYTENIIKTNTIKPDFSNYR